MRPQKTFNEGNFCGRGFIFEFVEDLFQKKGAGAHAMRAFLVDVADPGDETVGYHLPLRNVDEGFYFSREFSALGKNGVLAGQIFQIPLENVP